MLERASLDGDPAWLREWVGVERVATSLRTYQGAVVPGLLQTERYARALLANALLTPERIEQRVTARLARQELLTRDEPPLLVAVLDEHVLRRPVGGPEVMREQLEHLLAVAALPLVRVQVVPASVGSYPGVAGAFVLANLPDGIDVIYLDNPLRGQVLDRLADVRQMQRMWLAIQGEALWREESARLIGEVAETWS